MLRCSISWNPSVFSVNILFIFKAHDKLSIREMEDLISTLFECSNPTCCPHGRPTIIHFSKYDIEKMFKRSGI